MKGRVRINKINKYGEEYDVREFSNLFVDDGKEYVLDFLAGIQSWHNPMDRTLYTPTTSGVWTTQRWLALGSSMFNNKSQERVKGQDGIPTGMQDQYPIQDTILVSPEDSYLSNEVGVRVQADPTRRDQTVEFYARFNVPSDINTGVEIREFGLFLQSTGPLKDPSYLDGYKPKTMICRAVNFESGVVGGTGVYVDDPLIATDNIELRWKFGEL